MNAFAIKIKTFPMLFPILLQKVAIVCPISMKKFAMFCKLSIIKAETTSQLSIIKVVRAKAATPAATTAAIAAIMGRRGAKAARPAAAMLQRFAVTRINPPTSAPARTKPNAAAAVSFSEKNFAIACKGGFITSKTGIRSEVKVCEIVLWKVVRLEFAPSFTVELNFS